jgi:hypothetical protein
MTRKTFADGFKDGYRSVMGDGAALPGFPHTRFQQD